MEVKVNYSTTELENAVKFIATHNTNFIGQYDYIRDRIISFMNEMAIQPDSWSRGTMGFYLIADREDEGMNRDDNFISFEILVNPALCQDREYTEYTISSDIEEQDETE